MNTTVEVFRLLSPIIGGGLIAILANAISNKSARGLARDKALADDRAARYSMGREDAIRALDVAESLLATMQPAVAAIDVKAMGPTPIDPLMFESSDMRELSSRVHRITDSILSDRLTWLLRGVENPRTYLPEIPINVPFYQMMLLGHVIDELARFVRRDEAVDKAADLLSKQIAQHYRTLYEPKPSTA